MMGKLDRHIQNNETRPISYTIQNINSKQVKDLIVKPKTAKFIEGNLGTKFLEIGLNSIFVNLTPKAMETKQK